MENFTHRYLTIEDLFKFCQQTNMDTFSANDVNGPIIVQSFGEIRADDNTTFGLTPCTLMACHTELNKNKSFISEDVMNKALSSFSNRPILGYIHRLEDGTWNFWDHRMSIEEDGDNVRVEYLESPIGVIPESCNAHLEYSSEHDKNYVVVNGFLYDEYGNRAVEIIKENGGCVDVSVELAVNAMSYNAKDNCLNIEDFTFMGVTCLGKAPDGTDILPGMDGSNLKLDNFSAKQNSMFSAECQNKLIEVLEKLDATLSSFNKKDLEEGGDEMDNFENEVVDEITEAVVEEAVEVVEEETETQIVIEEEAEVEEPSTSEDGDVGVKCELKYEISHEDVRNALYNLLRANSDDEYYYAWIVEVYDNKFIYEDSNDWKYYRQKYTKDGDNVAFDGERVEVFSEWLSKDEKDALDALKADYAELKSFKEGYEAAELKAKKDAIFAKDEYSILTDDEAFKALVKDAEKFSVEEVESKVKSIFADHVIKTGTFSAKVEEKKTKTIGLNFNAKPSKKKSAYGGLFEKDE